MGASLFVIFITFLIEVPCQSTPCIPRKFDQDSVVCVCNSTYCDRIVAVERSPLTEREFMYTYYQAYVTTKAGHRLKFHQGSLMPQEPNEYLYNIEEEMYQTILGFGGAFTDAATMTMDKLSENTRSNMIESYFGKSGIEYNLGRIPMASCDFSTRLYSYDDQPGDFNLTLFKLATEDLKHKIPVIKDAMSVSAREISLFGSPWSCPYWLKTNGNMTGMGQLKGKPGDIYHKTWAQYFVNFLKAYKDQGVDLWGLTAQNEPTDGLLPFIPIQSLGWTAELQRDFIAKDLGPALRAAGFENIKLMILDDQRLFLPKWAEVVLSDPEAAKYVSGIAVHWYEDQIVSPSVLDETYEKYGNEYFILNTEACERNMRDRSKSVLLGNWARGEHYFTDIVEDLKHGVSGWVDWNIALDMKGGPNWLGNWVDSPVIVNLEKDEFYKQPMFYAMAHFSKFLKTGSKVLSYTTGSFTKNSDIKEIFFQTEERSIVANFINKNSEYEYGISINDSTVPGILNFNLPPSSMVTFTWFRSWL